jgi:3-oxoadipate enol-lactonase
MPIFERAGAKIHDEVSGDGTAIVFAHDFPCDGGMFAHQVAALQHRWRVINVDLRGHGRSGPAPTPVTFYDFADDVIANLDAGRVDRAVWAGLWMGGFTALRAGADAARACVRARALVLMDTDAGAETPGNRVQSVVMRGAVRAFGIAPVRSRPMTIMFGPTARVAQPALCDAYRRRFLSLDARSMLSVARAVSARDALLPRLGQIGCPTLVIVGEEDMALPVALSRRLAAGVRGAEVVLVPRAVHLPAVEAPALVKQRPSSASSARSHRRLSRPRRPRPLAAPRDTFSAARVCAAVANGAALPARDPPLCFSASLPAGFDHGTRSIPGGGVTRSSRRPSLQTLID